MQNALSVASPICLATSLSERTQVNENAQLDSVASALSALTDFREDSPITVEAHRSIDDALEAMESLAVHALLVSQPKPGTPEQQVVGLLTYYDIERRHLRRHSRAGISRGRSAVCVGEIMTACDELPLVKYETLDSLTARELYEMFQGTGLTHLLVVEYQNDHAVMARGLVARAALAKRLGRLGSPPFG